MPVPRHPLYAVEILTLIGTAIQFAAALGGAAGAERDRAAGGCAPCSKSACWSDAYPEYASYRARVKRFGIV